MENDAHLIDVAILVERGFPLSAIWEQLPWEGDMPEDFVEAFAAIYRRLDNERIQRLG